MFTEWNGTRMGNASAPSNTIMIVELHRPTGTGLSHCCTWWDCGRKGGSFHTYVQKRLYRPYRQIHNGGCNYAFADGHVKWMKEQGYAFGVEKMVCKEGRLSQI